ncbi:hypothetical protein Vadar_021460 [Vaccinium darrowii]|uniref:Uncharacterized protein n=1 Tax=Vaccinium darrowii TaxID=229202 RepID=A0ACB7YNP6_9ERIC|nr:hypothetical protein Vadar_021460 [Vaccinium darrowii]
MLVLVGIQLEVNAFTENRLKLSLMNMFCHSVFVQAFQLMEYMFVLVSSTVELQPTREGGATCAPISIDLERDSNLSSKSIILQINSKNQQVSASKAFAGLKIDQAASEPKTLAAVQALLLGQGSRSTSDIPWIALFGETVHIASAQSGNVASENCLETAWQDESEVRNLY